MTPCLQLLAEPSWQGLTMVLLHFVWQGLLVALLVQALLSLLHRRSAHLRYLVCAAGLAAMASCPAVTCFLVKDNPAATAGASMLSGEWLVDPGKRPGVFPETHEHAGLAENGVFKARPRKDDLAGAELPGGGFAEECHGALGISGGGLLRAGLLEGGLPALQPWLLLGWACGVLVLGVRLLLGIAAVQRYKGDRHLVPAHIMDRARDLSRSIGLRMFPRIFTSARIREAAVFGLLRPVVLLPMPWLARWPPEVLDAVIAHELAHVRRWDLWVNIAQRVLEVFLFYHPCVWWLSRRLRVEREMCCDDLAVEATGEPVSYVKALETTARQRLAALRPAFGAGMGGTKMNLLARVMNVLGRTPARSTSTWFPVILLVLVGSMALWFGGLRSKLSAQPEERREGREVERPRAVGEGEGDRARAEAERPERRSDEAREGERGDRGEGDEARERERRRDQDARRDSEERREGRGDRPREGGDARRSVERKGGGPVTQEQYGALLQVIQQLRREVARLQREVDQLKTLAAEAKAGAGKHQARDDDDDDDKSDKHEARDDDDDDDDEEDEEDEEEEDDDD